MYLQIIAIAGLAAGQVAPPAPSSCATPGASLCNGQDFIGSCNIDNMVVWQHVAAGAVCSCQSPGYCIQAFPSGTPTASQPVPPISTTPSSPSSIVPPATSATPSGSASGSGSASASATASNSHPVPVPSSTATYQIYNGDGSTEAGWPSMQDWLDFEVLWKGYEPNIGAGCTTAFTVRDNTQNETNNLKKALQSEAAEGGVPLSFAFVIMMQESLGCVAVDTTNNGVVNPGIFQSHNGIGTCSHTTECPMSEIKQMAHDGICETPSGDGLQRIFQNQTLTSGAEPAQQWYRVARMYNSGPSGTDLNDLNNGGDSTSCYVMDVANRITGQWYTGTDSCPYIV